MDCCLRRNTVLLSGDLVKVGDRIYKLGIASQRVVEFGRVDMYIVWLCNIVFYLGQGAVWVPCNIHDDLRLWDVEFSCVVEKLS